MGLAILDTPLRRNGTDFLHFLSLHIMGRRTGKDQVLLKTLEWGIVSFSKMCSLAQTF